MQEPQDVLNVSVIWRGNKYIVEMNSNASLKELGHELQKLTDVKADTMRLIVPQVSNKGSKLLYPFSDKDSCLSLQQASILEGKSIRMMGVSEDEVDKVQQNAKADLRIAGFDEDEKRMRQRMSYRPHASLKLPQGPYIFCDFRTLQIPGVELNPPASEALKRMHMLAADPGVVAIMNKHRWRVGIMTEMAPVGYVGVSPKCILGFNKNHGEEISLRLRTDDLKGFRKYESIKKTLLHELAHMVYSEHDANFYALDKQLNQEAASLDWTKSRGHTLSRVKHSEQYEEDFNFGDREILSQKLGGNMSDQLASARASSVAAAYQRLANASANSSGASEVNEEPDPDDSGFNIHEEFDAMESVGKENVDIESLNRAEWKPNYEPDPDDGRSGNNKFEPDPDYSQGGETLEPDSEMIELGASLKTDAKLAAREEPDPDDSSILVEPDPDDCQTMEIMNSGILLKKTINEPDPDDLGEQQNNLGHGNIARPDLGDSIVTEIMEDQTHLNKAHKEPDPDESHANGLMQAEPDPDESYANGFVQAEPDPDESHANGFVQAEPDPDESHANGLMQGEPDPDDNMMPPLEISSMNIDEPDPDDQEIQRIQDSVTVICGRLQKAIEMLRAEVEPMEATAILQTLFKIISNVIKHPDEMKFKRLRMANPIIQRNIANYKAAMEILVLIGFNEDVVLDGIGKAEPYLVLKRNDPGLLWLAKSSLEACIAY